MYFDELTMTEFKTARQKADGLVIWPVGITEEHGPHLPLATDSIQGEWTVNETARTTGALVAPPLRYGLAQSTRNFPGTISISFDTLRTLATEILREFLRQELDRVVVLSGHAGSAHMMALRLAGQRVMTDWKADPAPDKGREPRIMVLSDWDLIYGDGDLPEIPAGDGHAGAMETSRIMVIRPDLLKGTAKAEFPPHHNYRIVTDPERWFPSGVMGDPSAASLELGEKLNTVVVEGLTRLIKEFRN